MKLQNSLSRFLARIGLVVGLAFLAGFLLTVSIVLSAESSRPQSAPAPAAAIAELNASAPATQAAPPAPLTQAEAGQPEPAANAGLADPTEAVRAAWQLARDAGVYAFATDLAQITFPARSLSNVGRGPNRSQMHMEGKIDQPAGTLEFRMWQPALAGAGGAVDGVTPGSGAEARH